MPRIELIPEVLYGPDEPYHWEYDNLPLKNILRRQNLINLALDDVIEDIRNAIGSQGTLSNRLAQSIDDDGSLKTTAIDEALHSIEEHEDTDDYVRMTRAESEKLELVADEATNVTIEVHTDGSSFVEFDEGTIKFVPSSTVTPSIESPNRVSFNLAFPTSAAHRHYYGLEPVHVTSVTPDYTNYKVNSGATAYVEGSLRVYVNGVRIFEDAEVYVPGALVTDAWTLLSVTPDHAGGTFELSSALGEDDVIRIDFDKSLV